MKTEHLIVMFNEGRLSEFLAERFQGKLYPPPWGAKDNDFIIFFEDESKMPETSNVKEVIVEKYSQLGCTIDEVFPRQNEESDSLCLKICADREDIWYDITISSRYPFQNGLSSMRTTCHFNGSN